MDLRRPQNRPKGPHGQDANNAGCRPPQPALSNGSSSIQGGPFCSAFNAELDHFAIFGAVRPWDKPPAAILRKGGVEREQNDPAPLDAERHSMTRGQLAGC